MRPGPFFPGQFPAANVQLLKDGRLAPTGMELGSGDPRLGTLDIGKQSIRMRVRECKACTYRSVIYAFINYYANCVQYKVLHKIIIKT
jgi:hypothetical protein